MSEIGFEQDNRRTRVPCYSPGALEARWQRAWRETRSFASPGPANERKPAYVFADCPIAPTDAPIGALRGFTIADACARFLRARGRAVLFSLCLDSFGPSAEAEARLVSVSPREWVQDRGEQIRKQLELLGCSCDWERAFATSDHEFYGQTQSLFLTMLEHDLIYQRDKRWFMRMGQYIDESERGLEALTGWDATAIDSQRATMGRIDGVELLASIFGGSDLTVFTPHADALAKATFVAVSPAHPEVGKWATDPTFAEQLAAMKAVASRRESGGEGEMPMAVTGALATVPGVAGMLPVIVSPLVDVRFGATAVLGIPELDCADRAIAQRLPKPAGAAWKTSGAGPAARPAARYRVDDSPISCPRAWGAPIPLVHCPACGVVPVPREDLPVRLPDDLSITAEGENPLADRADFQGCLCPRCEGAARRETDTIDCRFDRMWMWMAICVPAEHRSSAIESEAEYGRWLPAEQVVSRLDAACMFERRVLARILQDLGELEPLADREPFPRALMHQIVRLEDATTSERLGDAADPGELIARVGADAVRLAMLYAAAPSRAFTWNDQPLRHCQRFLNSFYGYAEPRLRAWADRPGRAAGDAPVDAADATAERAQPRIDASEKLRRRLAYWCTVACEKVTLQLDRLELQRAAHNTMLLLTRIQDFESRASKQRGALEALDREAIVAALLLLARLLAPLTPHIAEELWSIAGHTKPIGDAGWPTLSRPARATMTS